MFEQVVVAEAYASKRFWTTCAGVTSQVALVAAMILAPMVWPEALPSMHSIVTLLTPPGPPPGPPPKPPEMQQTAVRAVQHKSIFNLDGTINIPKSIPREIPVIVDEAPAVVGSNSGPCIGCVPGGLPTVGPLSNLLTSTLNAIPRPLEPTRPTVERAAPAPEPIRTKIGGNVLAGKLISRVDPIYPQMAKAMRVQGAVELMAIVGADGRVKELNVISGSPLLTKAALDAVKQWIYRPTYLNGDPVEVTAPITVNFRLN